MAWTMFLTSVVGRVLMWGVIWLGVYVAIRAVLDGEVLIAVLILLIGIPVALFLGRLIVGVASVVFLVPLSFLVRRRREFKEFMNVQLALVDSVGTDRLNLRQGWRLLHMFNELPPPEHGAPARSGAELIELYTALHYEDRLYEDAAAPRPAPS